MRQRLGIARALVNDPAVVFLDEPTLGLDPQGQRDVLETVARLASERGVTVLVSTHLLDEVEQVCTDVLILNRGRVAALGPVAEVVARAAAPRSARLRTDPSRCEEAVRVLAAVDAVGAAGTAPGGRPGEVAIELSALLGTEAAAAAALAALIEAGLPIAEFSLEGGRLSDAFLEVVSA